MTAKAKTALRKKPGKGEHRALTAGEAPAWKPGQGQLRALDMVAVEPALATRPLELCNLMQISKECWYRWNRSAKFRQWWNAQLIEIARLRSGPALMRLVELLEKPSTEPRDASKLADTFLKHVGVDATPNASGALIAIMEKWKGRRMRLAVEVDGVDPTDVPVGRDAYPAPSDLFSGLHKDHYQNLKSGQISIENPPPGAMEVGPGSVERQARVTLEVAAELEGEGGSESGPAAGSAKGSDTLGSLPGGGVTDHTRSQETPAPLGAELLDVIHVTPNPVQILPVTPDSDSITTPPLTIPPPGIVDRDLVDPEDIAALEDLGIVDHVQARLSQGIDDGG